MNIAAIRSRLPGLLLSVCLALIASGLGKILPLIGGAAMGIILGIGVCSWKKPPETFTPGIQFASRILLQWSIVALGFCLPLARVIQTGWHSLSVTLFTMGAAFASAAIAGRWLKVPKNLCLLIGTGTAICGGSAIAAITPVVKPDAHESAFSLSTIFLFNVVAVIVFPWIGHGLGLSDLGFGLWAGTAINDTSSVVAAAYAWSSSAGEYATIIKLTRAMMIVPVTLLMGVWLGWHRNKQSRFRLRNLADATPGFILCFILASALGSHLPYWVAKLASTCAPLLITIALTAIGLSCDIGKIRSTGWRPIALGLIVWVCVASTSLLVQAATSNW